MKGTLYVCATPIGNLKDITLRCIETLKEVDLIAAEDTRHTLKLLNHYNIKNKLESYHEHNKTTKGEKLINLLNEGKNIALVSDAGMPGISDPGEDLIKLCYQNSINVTVLPGATASVTALILSGLKTRSYCFEGFLPTNKKLRKDIIEKLKTEQRTTIFYVSPHDLKETLQEFFIVIGEREISIIKELTKKHEEILKCTLTFAINYFKENQPKGEYVLVLSGSRLENKINCAPEKTIHQLFDLFLQEGFDPKDAIKKVAKEKNISKREVYKIIKIENNEV